MMLSEPTPKQIFHALLRNELSAFIEKTYYTVDGSQEYISNWHIDLIADALKKCERGESRRLIVNLPPRSLKSICVSVAFPAWLLGRDPRRRIINVSYSEELAAKHARDCRAVIESDWYRNIFPYTRLNPHKRSEGEFETLSHGYRLSTSIGGTLTGRGGGFIIVDDPLKPNDANSDTKRNLVNNWFGNTLFSRLDNKETGCIIIVMQRVHLEDLAGFLQQQGGWEVLNLAAIAPQAETHILSDGRKFHRAQGEVLNPALEAESTLTAIKANIGSYNFSAQYQQEPVPQDGNIIQWKWFPVYQDIPAKRGRWSRIVQSWDTAMKAHDGSDYSVCITACEVDKKLYILDIYRAKLDFPELRKKIPSLKQQFGADVVIIEDKGSGTGLIQQLRSEGFGVIEYKPVGDKKDRAVAQSAHIEGGKVYLPEHASWLEDFRMEIASFPYGRNDDQIDALSQLLDWVWKKKVGILDILAGDDDCELPM
ncbi:MAG TPA: phage terminase large subunit [Rickettsiales bacterium]|nr:phage terminase large subunit [Rickettsiales bacterium]